MSGARYLLDTNVVIGFLKGDERIVAFFQRQLSGQMIAVSLITRLELLSYPGITAAEERQIRQFLSHITILDLDLEIQDRAIALRRQHRFKLPDALILASALAFGGTMVTGDAELVSKPVDGCPLLNPFAPLG